MQKSDAARIIAGLTPAETKQSSAPTSVHVMSGEVVGNSESGKVQIRMDGDVVSPNDDQIIEIDALGGLEEGDTATILLTGQPGRAMTPMVMGSSGSVDRIVERIKTIEADYIKATEIEAEVATFGYLKTSELETEVGKFGYLKANQLEAEVATFGYLKADDLEAEVAEFGYLKANSATITDLQADTAKIHNLSANDISAATGYIHDLTSGNVTAQNIIADHGDFSTVKANAAKVANLTAQELEADHATIANLDSSYAQIDMANVNNAWIANGLIKDAAIKSEMVESISANQLTAGEIDADEITVRNLKASSLTVQTADGYVYVGEKRIPTKEFIDSLKDELQNEIDGAIETFTVSAVPTLNNTPANEWVVSGDAEATRKLRAKHVGDIAYVVNSSSEQNGYCYRFAYDATAQEFKWVLIKDSDVTAALSRLTTAEGKITGLETFESNTTTWMNETDDGLETIRTNHTNLSGRVDKTVVETKQLWFTKANTTAPNKPTTAVTSTSTAGNAWRVVVPAWNASYPNYYYCLQYKLADGTYAWSDVVRDIAMGESQQQGRKGVADAATADGKAVSAQNTANANIKSSVQLWFTKANSTAPDKPNAQVTTNNASTTNAWNLAIPTYNSSYPHYFYCYQQQKGDGTYQWSDVVYDRSVTEAQAKAQAALPSSTFTTFQSTTFKNLVDEVDEQSSTITQLSNSVSSVGNILTGNVANPSNWIISAPSGASYTKEAYGTAGVKVTFNSVGGFEWLYSQPIAVTSGNKYMVFFDYTVGKTYTTTSGKSGYGLVAYSGSNAPSGSYDDGNARFLGKAEFSKTASGDRVLKGSFTFTATSDSIVLGLNGGQIADNQTGLSFTIDNLVVGETLSTTSTTVNQVKQTADSNRTYLTNLTTTLGTNADGTSKSEDIVHKYNTLDQTLDGTVTRVGKTEASLKTISNPNLSPFFSMAPYRTATSYDGGYWQPTNDNWLMGGITRLSDGWAHISVGKSKKIEVAIPRIESLSAGDKATLLIEWRDVTVTGSPNIYARNYPENCQFNLNAYKVTWTSESETSGSRLIVMTVNSTADGDMNWNATINLGMSNGSGVSFDGDLRISLYEGEYDGSYKPYVDQSLSERVSTAETSIEQTANNVLIKATKSDTTAAQGGQHLIQSLINVAPEGVKIQADKVNIEGAAIFTSGRLSDASLNDKVSTAIDSIEIGGRNLLLGTGASKTCPAISLNSNNYAVYNYYALCYPYHELFVENDLLTLSFDWSCTATSGNFRIEAANGSPYIFGTVIFASGTRSSTNVFVDVTSTNTSGRVVIVFKATSATVATGDDYKWLRIRTDGDGWSGKTFTVSNAKIERGNKATDWTPAPEDQTAYVDSIQIGGRNLLRRSYYQQTTTVNGITCTNNGDGSVTINGTTTDTPTVYCFNDSSASSRGHVTLEAGTYTLSGCPDGGSDNTWRLDMLGIPTSSGTVTAVDYGDGATFTTTGGTPTYIRIRFSSGITLNNFTVWPKLERGNKPTDWTPAPEDVDASIATAQSTANSAIKRSQRIYYRSSTDQPPTSMPTAWVTESGNKWAANRKTVANWTTKVTPISNGTGASVTKYLYLWTCLQYQLADGSAPQYTTVLLDDTTTVIDGGKIITGSLSANSINASSGTFDVANIPNLNASKINAGDIAAARIKTHVIDAINSLTAGQINADRIKVSEISIGQSQVSGLSTALAGKETAGAAAAVQDNLDALSSGITWMGTCATAAGTAAKVVVCEGFGADDLKTGATICVRFASANTVSDAITLNVNSTGAKTISAAQAVTSATNHVLWGSGATIRFYYNETYWRVADTQPSYYGTCGTAAGTAAKTASVSGVVIFAGTTVNLNMTKDNTNTSATLNVSSTGAKAIYYGTSTTRPTTSNGYGWHAAETAPFIFDGQFWRYVNSMTSRTAVQSAKTATNYIYASSDGIKIANASPSSATTYQLQTASGTDFVVAGAVRNRINGNGVTLYDGNGVADSNIVAKFASKLIELGKNAPDAIIRLCGGKLDLTYFHDTDTGIQYGSLYSQNYMRVLSGTDSPSGDAAYGSVSASQSQGHMSGGVSAGYKNGTTLKTSSLSANVAVSESETPNVSAHVYSGTTSSGTEASFKLDLSGFSINGSTPIKAIYADTTVVQLSNGKWLSLANPTVVAQKLGSGASQANTVCIAQNGGHESYTGVVTGAMGSDGSARAYIYPNHTGYIRINFILIRFA